MSSIKSSRMAAASAPEAQLTEGDQIGSVQITWLVKRSIPITKKSQGPSTIGSLVDNFISDAITDGQEVLSLTINFTPEEWKKLVG